MSDPNAHDDRLTDALLRDVRRQQANLPAEFADLVEDALLEGFAGRYDGSYPPAGHTYPTT